MPSTWVAVTTEEFVYPVWQEPQFAFCGWCEAEAGGLPWQAVHVSLVLPDQRRAEALWFPPVKLPWQ